MYASSPTEATPLAISVATADPAMPSFGAGPSPRMNTGLSPESSSTLSPMNQSGVIASPAPRSPIISNTSSIAKGSPAKITRR